MLKYLDNPWFWAIMLWSFIWKGMALWKAGERKEKGWFLVLYIINTAGLLEIFYLFFVANKEKEVPSA
jgi:hypothetical protein